MADEAGGMRRAEGNARLQLGRWAVGSDSLFLRVNTTALGSLMLLHLCVSPHAMGCGFADTG